MIPYGRQDISEEDIEAVANVLRSDFLTQGPAVPSFERAVAEYCGANHAVAVNSATSALHVACLALGVGRGDRVWTSPITFLASANCALYCGASVDFVDIDPRTYNISARCLREKLESARRERALPKVVIAVHFAGQSCEMREIKELGNEFGFRIIEDASHAIGGGYLGERIGSCRYSDISVFSFHPVKLITTGEGGMAVTNDDSLSRAMSLFRSHGMTREKSEMTRPPDGPWYYQQISLGFNYRMTDIQAALGLSQLKRLDDFVSRRHSIAARYERLLANMPLVLPWQDPRARSGLHLFVVRLKLDRIRRDRKAVFESLRSAGVGVQVHYIPVYLQPFYKKFGFVEGYCEEAERYYSEAFSLPMFPTLTDQEQDYVVSALTNAICE